MENHSHIKLSYKQVFSGKFRFAGDLFSMPQRFYHYSMFLFPTHYPNQYFLSLMKSVNSLTATMLLICAPAFLSAQSFRDQKLESLLTTHKMQAADKLIRSILDQNRDQLTALQKTYYYTHLTDILLKTGSYVDAAEMSQKAITEAKSISDSMTYYRAWISRATVLNAQSKITEAHQYLIPAYHFALREKSPQMLRLCYVQLGAIASQNNQIDKSLQWYKEARNISIQENYTHLLHGDEANIALIYCLQAKPDSAITILNRAIQLAVEDKDSSILALCYNIKAVYHLLKQDKDSWRNNIKLSLAIGEKISHRGIITAGYSQLMEDAIGEKRYRDAISLGKTSYDLIRNEKLTAFVYHFDTLMYESYQGLGKLDSAIYFLKKYYTSKAAALNQEQSDKLSELMVSFTMKEKNLVIENQRLELENSQGRTRVLLISNFLLVLLLGGGYTYNRLRKASQNKLYQKEKLTQYLLDQEKNLGRIHQNDEALIASVAIADEDQISSENDSIEYISEEKKELYHDMIRAIESQKLYLNPNLDVNLIVTILGTNKLYLYQAISKNASENFRNIINRYRVEEAKRQIEREVREHTVVNIEHVYSSSGFNSTSSFYRIFRHFTGLTPNEYKQEYTRDIRP